MNGERLMKTKMIQTIRIIKMPWKDHEFEESGRESKLPSSKGRLENALGHIYSEQSTGLTPKVSEETLTKCITSSIHWMEKPENGTQTMPDKQTSSLHGKPS